MAEVVCTGIAWLGLCNYDPASPSPNYFTLGNAVTALAFTLTVQNFLKPIYIFRLAIRHVTIWRLYALVFTGALCCVIAALVPRVPLFHGLLIGYAIVWEFIATILFMLAYGAVALAASSPIKIKPKRVPQFARSAAQLISEASETDHLEFLKDLKRSLPTLIHLAAFVEEDRETTAFYDFIHREKIEQGSYAHSLLLIIADQSFCRTLVNKAPWIVSDMLRRISEEGVYAQAAESFIHGLSLQAILSDDGIVDREMSYHGFGAAPLLSESLFSDPFIINRYAPLSFYLSSGKITPRILARFNAAALRTFETLIAERKIQHSYAAHRIKNFYKSAFLGLYKIQTNPAYDFPHVMVPTESVANAIKLAVKLMASLSDRSYDQLFLKDLTNERRHDLLEVLVEIVFDSLNAISNEFNGPGDPFWNMARSTLSDVFPQFDEQPDGMTPFQQRLAIKIVGGLNKNMRGWYPAISRIVLSTVGPYKENGRQQNRTAANILKDASYIELQRLPELAEQKPEKLGDYFPSHISYDPESNVLTHTYASGSQAITDLSQLQLDPVSLIDPIIRRPLSGSEREQAELDI